MKNLSILALFLFSRGFVSQGFYTQYFENASAANSLTISIGTNTNNIWQIGKPQKTLFSSASSTPNVIVTDTLLTYPPNNVSTFSLVVLNHFQMTGYPFALQWKQKLDMDRKKDGGIVELSTNSGITWTNAHNNPNVYQFYGFHPSNKDTLNGNQYCFSGTDSTWRDIWLCLPPLVTSQNDSILFRFTFKSDSVNTNKDGWMIDNIMAHPTITHPVKEISQIDDIVVYPNITNGIVNVEMKKRNSTDMIQNIELFNSEGKLVESFGQNYTKVVLDIAKHKAGIYFLNVTVNKKTKKFKILYEKN